MEASRQAAEAIGRQAVRVGVSFLADNTKLRMLSQKIGLRGADIEAAHLEEIATEAAERAREAAYRSLARQGREVLTKAAARLGCQPVMEQVKAKLEQKIFAAGTFEDLLVTFIQELQREVPDADVTALKMELLTCRTDLLAKFAAKTGKPPEAIGAALDSLTHAQSVGPPVFPPPPAVLPAPIRTLLRTFSDHVRKAHGGLTFLNSPAEQKRMIDQLAESPEDQFDQQINAIQRQIQDGLTSAHEDFVQAKNDIDQLKDELAELSVDAERPTLRVRSSPGGSGQRRHTRTNCGPCCRPRPSLAWLPGSSKSWRSWGYEHSRSASPLKRKS